MNGWRMARDGNSGTPLLENRSFLPTARGENTMATSKKKTTSNKVLVGILTGSPNDLPVVEKAKEVFDALGIPSEIKVLSAHRTPDRVTKYVSNARANGIEVLIACAGMAAHLAGVVAAQTTLPVIGVPLASGALSGFDALLSTVQMPPGIPVATVAVDGSKNAAYLAARILAATHPEIIKKLEADLASQLKKYDTV